jgi:predicted ATPase
MRACIAHFLTKLVQASKNLIEREQAITTLVSVCHGYLDGKKLHYDELKYSITIVDTTTGTPIELQDLSSGEKQIVSLLTHLYLRSERKVHIIIDEPELSLSVPWQRTLLPDLWRSGHCRFMAAVTHSPFIFDNDFEEYVVDLKDHIVYHG